MVLSGEKRHKTREREPQPTHEEHRTQPHHRTAAPCCRQNACDIGDFSVAMRRGNVTGSICGDTLMPLMMSSENVFIYGADIALLPNHRATWHTVKTCLYTELTSTSNLTSRYSHSESAWHILLTSTLGPCSDQIYRGRGRESWGFRISTMLSLGRSLVLGRYTISTALGSSCAHTSYYRHLAVIHDFEIR